MYGVPNAGPGHDLNLLWQTHLSRSHQDLYSHQSWLIDSASMSDNRMYPPPPSRSGDPRQWTPQQVEVWLRTHKHGKLADFAPKFASISGDELCDLTEDQLLRFVNEDPRGAIIFNDLVKLQTNGADAASVVWTPALPSPAASSEWSFCMFLAGRSVYQCWFSARNMCFQ